MNRMSKLGIFFFSITICFLLLLILVYSSYLYPGVLKPIDKLRCNFCKTTIEKVDYAESEQFNCGISLADRYTKNAISFSELTPYLEQLKPGTILITSHGKSICALIPGVWKHTMIYLGNQQQTKDYFGVDSEFYKDLVPYYKTRNEHLMIDASIRQNVAIRCISSMASLQETSTLKMLLCFEPKLNKYDNLEYINNTIKELGKKYDLTFDNSNSNELYCTEIITNALQPYGVRINSYSDILKRKVTLPKDLVKDIIKDEMFDNFIFKYCISKENDNIRYLTISQVAQLPNDRL